MFTKTTFTLAIIICCAASSAIAATKDLPNGGSGGFGNGPYHQGTPMDRLPVWRGGHYQGNDPDSRIRLQLMRDGRNGRLD